MFENFYSDIIETMKCFPLESFNLKGNCHELRMDLSKFVCGNMAGFLATFRSRNLLFRWSSFIISRVLSNKTNLIFISYTL